MNLTDPGDFKVKMIVNTSEGINLKQKTPDKYVTIRGRTGMQYSINKYGIKQYVPPSYKDSNFFINLQAMIFKTGFKFENTVNV